MLREKIVVIDFETTGLSPEQGDRITEVAALRIEGDRIVDSFDSLVNCGVRVPRRITELTGITQRMVDSAPPAREVLRELIGFVGQTPVVAHNASFDHRFFNNECEQAGERNPHGSFICSMRVSRRVYPKLQSYSLSSIAQTLGVKYSSSAHRARADAEVTANVMINIANELQRRHRSLVVDARVLRELMSTSVASAARRLAQIARETASDRTGSG